MPQSWNPLEGACDLHIHIGPDTVERYYDSDDLAREAESKQMKALVLKDQLCPSAFKARLSQKTVENVRVFGSVVLNETCGGLLPRSVAYALRCGAKVVWMPTVDAKYAYQKGLAGHWISHVGKRNAFGAENPQYTATDEDGRCLDAVKAIMKLVREADAVLATGHISPQECLVMAQENQAIGAKLLITHPNLWFEDFTMDYLKQYAALGAVLEFTSGGLTPDRGHGDLYEMVEAIRAVGYEHCILSTDGGNIASPSPPEDLRSFCYKLRNAGIPQQDIERMVRDNPAKLLGL